LQNLQVNVLSANSVGGKAQNVASAVAIELEKVFKQASLL